MNKLSRETLEEIKQGCMEVLLRKSKQQEYILIKPEDVIAMITEISELRKLADPQAMTAAYTLGLQNGKAITK